MVPDHGHHHHDNNFFSRHVSKESSMANSSCRVYYGEAAGAVPFMWESQPGTPKHTLSHTSLPPLTPPPPFSTNPKNPKSMPSKKTSKAKLLLATIFPTMRKTHMSSPSLSAISSSSSSSSSSYLSWSSSSHSSASSSLKNQKGTSTTSTSTHHHEKRHPCFSVSRKKQPFDYYDEDDDDDDDDDADLTSGSPTSTLCFGVKHKPSTNFNGIRGGCFSVRNMKFAFLSITSSSRQTRVLDY